MVTSLQNVGDSASDWSFILFVWPLVRLLVRLFVWLGWSLLVFVWLLSLGSDGCGQDGDRRDSYNLALAWSCNVIGGCGLSVDTHV